MTAWFSRRALFFLFCLLISVFCLLASSPAAHAACGAAGNIVYNNDHHVMQYCDGTNWIMMGPPGPGGDIKTGLVGWWKLDETSGTSASDSSGNANTGTTYNTPTWGAGKINNALTFATGSSQYVSVPDVAGLRFGTGDFTVAAWIKFPLSGSSNNEGIVSKGYTTAAPAHTWGLIRDTTLTNQIDFQDATDAGGTWGGCVPWATVANGWHHIAVTRSAGTCTMYTDGVAGTPTSGTVNPVSLQLGSAGTVALWAKYTDSSYDYLVSKDYGSGTDINGYTVYIGAGKVTGLIANATTPNIINSTSTYNDGKWHHIAFTWDGSFLNLYVDGATAAAPVAQTVNAISTAYNLQLGIDGAGGAPNYYTGSLDDARIYNRALSASEVAALAQAGHEGDIAYNNNSHQYQYCDGTNWVAMRPTTGGGAPSTGLVGWWRLDESSGPSSADSSGNGNTGTWTNGPTYTASGKINGALTLNGTSQYATVNDAASLDLAGSWTVSTWVNLSSIPATTKMFTLLTKTDSTSNENYSLRVDNNYGQFGTTAPGSFVLQFATSGGTDEYAAYTPASISTGTWYLVTGTWNGTTLTLYLNGVSVATNVPGAVPASAIGGSLVIGDHPAHLALQYTAGTLDDTRVYNRALSSTEINALYNYTGGSGCGNVSSTGFVGWWTFDESSGTSAADSSGSGNTGTTYNSPTWATGMINNALTFNGSSQYVDAGNPASLQLGSTGTVAFWMKYTGIVGTFVSKADAWGDLNGYTMYVDSNSHIRAEIANGSSNNNIHVTPMLNDGTWHHLVMTWDGSWLRVYVDGTEDAASPVAQTLNPVSNVWNLQIGNNPSGAYYLPGSMDDVRVYNRALSAAEVAALYKGVDGAMIYDGTNNVMRYCNGASWVGIGK